MPEPFNFHTGCRIEYRAFFSAIEPGLLAALRDVTDGDSCNPAVLTLEQVTSEMTQKFNTFWNSGQAFVDLDLLVPHAYDYMPMRSAGSSVKVQHMICWRELLVIGAALAWNVVIPLRTRLTTTGQCGVDLITESWSKATFTSLLWSVWNSPFGITLDPSLDFHNPVSATPPVGF